MPVTLKDVERIAVLARLSFNEEEKKKLTGELNRILDYMEQLNEVETESVEPLSHVIEPNHGARADELRPSLSREDALHNAPDRTDKFFRVPKVIGER